MLRTQISNAQKEALKNKETLRLNTVRLINAAIKDRDIEDRGKGNKDGIDEPAILSLLQSMIKQRRDSIEMYTKGGRNELAEQEQAEIIVIESFLPQQMDAIATEKAVKDAAKEAKATSMKDMGKIMGILKEKYPGQMDMGKASAIVKAQLG